MRTDITTKKLLRKTPAAVNSVICMVFIFFFSGSIILSLYKKAIATPYPAFVRQNILHLVIFCLINILMMLTLYKISQILRMFNFNIVLIIILLVSFVTQIIFIILVPATQCYDPHIVINCARQFISGNYKSLEFNNYLNYYPNNIGLTLFFALIFKAIPAKMLILDGFILRVINVFFSMMIIIFSLGIYKICTPSAKRSWIFFLLTLVSYPLMIMDNNLVYNNIISTTFGLAAVYCTMKFVSRNKFIYIVLVAILIMFGYFIRQTVLLFLGAIILYLVFNAFFYRKISIIKTILGIILMLTILTLPFQIFNYYGVKSGVLKESIGPYSNSSWRWINIGVPSDTKLGYWDNGRNINLFRKTFKCDKEKSGVFFKVDTKLKLKNTGLKGTIKAYIKKAYWLWSEGTYDVNFISLGQSVDDESVNFIYETPMTKLIYKGSFIRKSIDWYLYSYNWLIMLAVVGILIYSIKFKHFRLDLLFYILLTFFIFYLIWEIKGRYLLNVFPILVLIYAYTFEKFIKKTEIFLSIIKQK